MSMNKNMLAAAIVSGLFATSAQAAVTLSSTPTTSPVTVATEAFGTNDAGGTVFTNAGNTLDIITPFNYSFSDTEVRYARIECGPGVTFTSATVSSTTAPGGNVFGAVNGVGTNAISFSITAGSSPVQAADTFTIDGNRNITSGAAASCTYGLYDQPSQAQAGGTTGRIATTSGAYINFASGYVFTTNGQQELTADVEADTGSFTKFIATGSPVSATLGRLTALRFDAAGGTQIDEDGLDIQLTDIFGAATAINIAGDFSFVTGASNVFLSTVSTCASSLQAATTVTASSASFTVGANARNPGADVFLCVVPNTTTPIPAGSYTATLNAVVSSALEYSVASTGPLAAGSIVRNGTELQAPLVQIPPGYISRMVLTNTGGMARPYTVTVLTESGNVRSGGDASLLTGSVPANSLVVVDLAPLLGTFSGAPRGTINVTVAGPDKQIQGLYQIVNPSNSSLSNHVMVRPGTN